MSITPPTFQDAKQIAKQLGVDGVIIVAINGDKFASAGYGQGKAQNEVKRIIDLLADSIRRSKVTSNVTSKVDAISPEDAVTCHEALEAIDQADRILEMIEELPSPGFEFGESVAEKVREIAQNVSRHNRVTSAQQTALDNMESGVSRWLD